MTWVVVVLIAGAILGIFLATFFLLSRAGNRSANRWLASFLFTFALVTLSDVLDRTIALHGRSEFLHLLDWMVLLLGPFLFFYVSELTGQAPAPRGALWVHAIPAALAFLIYLQFYSLSPEEKVAMVIAETGARQTGEPSVLALAFVVHIGFYAVLSFRALAAHARRLRDYYSSLEARNLRWLRIVLGMNVAVYILWTVAIVFPGELPGLLDDLAFPFSVFTLGVLALRHNEEIGLAAISGGAAGEGPPGEAEEAPTAEKYAKSGFTTERAAALRSRLDHLMATEKLYLNSDLNLPDLADRLGISTHHLSQFLNEDLQSTFYDFVNRLRVEEVGRMMADPALKDEKILSLAFSAGFNSKAAFNAAFKRLTGSTPREYRQRLSPPADARN